MSFLENFFEDDKPLKVNSHGKIEDNKRPIFKTIVNCALIASFSMSIVAGAMGPKEVHASELNTKSPTAYEHVLIDENPTQSKDSIDALYFLNIDNGSVKIDKTGIYFSEAKISKDKNTQSIENINWTSIDNLIKESKSNNIVEQELIKLKNELGLDINHKYTSNEIMDKLNIPKEMQSISYYPKYVKYNSNIDYEERSNEQSLFDTYDYDIIDFSKRLDKEFNINIKDTESYKSIIDYHYDLSDTVIEYMTIRDAFALKKTLEIEDTTWFYESSYDFYKDNYEDIKYSYEEFSGYDRDPSHNLNYDLNHKVNTIDSAIEFMKNNFLKDQFFFDRSGNKILENTIVTDSGNTVDLSFGGRVNLGDDISLKLYDITEPDRDQISRNKYTLMYKIPSPSFDISTEKANVITHKKDGSYVTYNNGQLMNIIDRDHNVRYTSNDQVGITKNLEPNNYIARNIHLGMT